MDLDFWRNQRKPSCTSSTRITVPHHPGQILGISCWRLSRWIQTLCNHENPEMQTTRFVAFAAYQYMLFKWIVFDWLNMLHVSLDKGPIHEVYVTVYKIEYRYMTIFVWASSFAWYTDVGRAVSWCNLSSSPFCLCRVSNKYEECRSLRGTVYVGKYKDPPPPPMHWSCAVRRPRERRAPRGSLPLPETRPRLTAQDKLKPPPVGAWCRLSRSPAPQAAITPLHITAKTV